MIDSVAESREDVTSSSRITGFTLELSGGFVSRVKLRYQ